MKQSMIVIKRYLKILYYLLEIIFCTLICKSYHYDYKLILYLIIVAYLTIVTAAIYCICRTILLQKRINVFSIIILMWSMSIWVCLFDFEVSYWFLPFYQTILITTKIKFFHIEYATIVSLWHNIFFYHTVLSYSYHIARLMNDSNIRSGNLIL